MMDKFLGRREMSNIDTPREYFQRAQVNRRNASALFVPSNVGVFLKDGKPPLIFSNYGNANSEKIEESVVGKDVKLHEISSPKDWVQT